MKFSDEEIATLVRGDDLARFPPPAFDARLEAFFRQAAEKVCSATGTKDRSEWGHYGSGYASFADAWFYHPDGRARLTDNEQHHAGIFILFSRLTHFYALGQAGKAWHSKGGSFNLPAIELIDGIDHPALLPTATVAEAILNELGLQRIRRTDLEPFIAPELDVPTILSHRPFRVFDALFHWTD